MREFASAWMSRAEMGGLLEAGQLADARYHAIAQAELLTKGQPRSIISASARDAAWAATLAEGAVPKDRCAAAFAVNPTMARLCLEIGSTAMWCVAYQAAVNAAWVALAKGEHPREKAQEAALAAVQA